MRKKIKVIAIPVKNLAGANAALKEIAEIKRDLGGIEANLNKQIDELKAGAEAEAAPLHLRLSGLENGLLAYAEREKEKLFTEKRTKALDFGSLGWRRSKEVKPQPKTTWAMVLGKIKEMKFAKALRIKETVNKDELHQWPDERLGLIGARRVEKDTFWYEVDEEGVADLAA